MIREQADEIERLASLLATARVRRTVVALGASANKKETKSGTERRVRMARDELRKYLDALVESEERYGR